MSVLALDRDGAAELDAADPLRAFRDRFILPDELVYLDGNSLGPLPTATAQRLAELVEREWGERLIRGWDEGWLELPVTVGDRIGALLGAAPGQTVVGDSTSVCMYKLLSAALDLRPHRRCIVTDRDNFPTDRYVVEGLAQARGLEVRWIAGDPCCGPSATDVAGAVDSDTAVVTLSHVAYRSAAIADMAAITEVAHAAGALTVWDLSHTGGSVPASLDDAAADLATGCTYKYLNGGPGAPAYMYVRAELLDQVRQPIWGWLGRRDPFAMAQGYVPATDIRRLLSGTPPVLALAAVDEGVRIVAEAGLAAIRAKGIALTELAIALIDARLGDCGAAVGSPRESTRRGAHVALVHPDARELCPRLAARGVIADFRTPDVIRLGLSPLVTRFVDVWDAIDAVHGMLA